MSEQVGVGALLSDWIDMLRGCIGWEGLDSCCTCQGSCCTCLDKIPQLACSDVRVEGEGGGEIVM